RAQLLGGVPLTEPQLMWWNIVARDRAEIEQAQRDWMDEADRFGRIETRLARVPVDPPAWVRPAS
ncbi:MAG: pirin-like C-terminal cupin domain-containing protein, partial [Acidimicrobiia bacterium]